MLNTIGHQGNANLKPPWDIITHPLHWLFRRKKPNSTNCWQECPIRDTLLHWWECKLLQSLHKVSLVFSSKAEASIPHDQHATPKYLLNRIVSTYTWEVDLAKGISTAQLFVLPLNYKNASVPINNKINCILIQWQY